MLVVCCFWMKNSKGGALSSPKELEEMATPRKNRSDGMLNTNRSNSSSLSNASIKSANDQPPPKSPYGSFMQTIRRIVPQDLACKVGCGGAKCKYCNSEWDKDEMAINGVFSNWITDDIVAMARPTQNLIEKFDLIRQMKKYTTLFYLRISTQIFLNLPLLFRLHIRSLFNLETRNEHKDCGSGILKHTGFSYDPNEFTQAGSKFESKI